MNFCRLFTVPYFSMSIAEVDGPSPCFLDETETGENAKCLWVEVVELIALRLTGGKNIFFVCHALHHPRHLLASRDQDWQPVELNDPHLRSHRKIWDCEECINFITSIFLCRRLFLAAPPTGSVEERPPL